MKLMDETTREMLAAAYVFGLLRGPARRRFERLRARDARYCNPATDWERRVTPLIEALPAEPLPSGLWSRIARRINETS